VQVTPPGEWLLVGGTAIGYRSHCVDRQHLDLLAVLRSYPDERPVEIHYGRDDRQDTQHALRVEGESDVKLVSHPGGHTFVRQLRGNGLLRKIIEQALAE
jgi:hypothetical protein